MITSFFKTSKPIHYIIFLVVLICMFVFQRIITVDYEVNLSNTLREVGYLSILLGSFFTLIFIISHSSSSGKMRPSVACGSAITSHHQSLDNYPVTSSLMNRHHVIDVIIRLFYFQDILSTNNANMLILWFYKENILPNDSVIFKLACAVYSILKCVLT